MLGLLVSCMYKMPLYQKIKQHVLKKRKRKRTSLWIWRLNRGNSIGLVLKWRWSFC